MNEDKMKLEKAIKNLNIQLEHLKKANECGLATKGEFKEDIQAIEIVLQELENSIPKKKIEDMLKEMEERKMCIVTSTVYSRDEKLEMLERNRLKRDILQELLEE